MNRRKRVAHVVVLVVIGVCFLTVPALAQDCPELVARVPGSIEAVAVAGDYAYIGSVDGLLIADVSNPSRPRLVGEARWGEVRSIAVSGGYAYAAVGDHLRVFDVSTPSAPVGMGSLDIGYVMDVAVEGGYAYVVGGWESGLYVIDISDPAAPVEVGFINTGWAVDVAIEGGYAYVAWTNLYSHEGGLRVFDVSTPSAPMEVSSVDPPGVAWGVAVSDGYAYVAAGARGLRVIDVRPWWSPVEVTFLDTPGDAHGVAVSGGYAYVVDWGVGLWVIDVRTPSAPSEVGFAQTDDGWNVAVSGDYAYVVGFDFGVIDVSTPSAPDQVGFVGTTGWTAGISVSGGYAYVAEGGGLRVIDVNTPSEPVVAGFVDIMGSSNVAVAGRYAYVAAESGLRVIDVSTPSTPVEIGFLDTPYSAMDVAVDGGYAYLAGDGLRVIDVSVPSAPAEVGFLGWPGGSRVVVVSGGYAYVAGVSADLRVFDVSTPSAPMEVGSYHGVLDARDVAVSGQYAYVIGDRGLWVIDVSRPSAPVEVGRDGVSGRGVAVSGGYAYVVDCNVGLRVVDVSTPSAPVEIRRFEENLASGVTVSDSYVFLTAAFAGLRIFNECSPLADASECFIPAAAAAAGAQGAFFQTDLELNNTGTEDAQVRFQWLPRGNDNSEPVTSEEFTIASGASLRFENVLTEVFDLGPDSLGALKVVASTESVIGMSRTYNIPGAKTAGTFGQGLPAIRATEMIKRTQPRRIIFLTEDFSSRANVGCVNGSSEPVTINVELINSQGESLEVRTMDLGPLSNDQINRIFEDYAPVDGYIDVWADSVDALYYCYGSILDNETSDPTTILPQVPSDDMTFIPAATLAAGLEGAFFRTDVDLNNAGSHHIFYELLWLPRGEDNSAPVSSETFSLAPGASVRYANVLGSLFGLESGQVGALKVDAHGYGVANLLAMSRTYNLPSAKVAGTFGQELPGIPADRMIASGVKKRIIFMSENDDVRANVGCVNGVGSEVWVAIELYGSDGTLLETKYMMLPPYSSRQINGIFQDYAPINGYVDVRTSTPDALIYCYGSVLDNLTSDPTTVLPQ